MSAFSNLPHFVAEENAYGKGPSPITAPHESSTRFTNQGDLRPYIGLPVELFL
jgi:hypothetical protein